MLLYPAVVGELGWKGVAQGSIVALHLLVCAGWMRQVCISASRSSAGTWAIRNLCDFGLASTRPP